VPHLLKGRSRQFNGRYAALASHYNFEPRFSLVRRQQEKRRAESRHCLHDEAAITYICRAVENGAEIIGETDTFYRAMMEKLRRGAVLLQAAPGILRPVLAERAICTKGSAPGKKPAAATAARAALPRAGRVRLGDGTRRVATQGRLSC
jgi:hypothetical protein